MDIDKFKLQARSFRNSVLGYFSASLVAGFISASFPYGSVMHILGLIASAGMLYFGIVLYTWFKDYPTVLRFAKDYEEELLRKRWRTVLGPISWAGRSKSVGHWE